MPHVPLVARRSIVYGSRRYAAGEAFDALTSDDARILLAIGAARRTVAGTTDPPPRADAVPSMTGTVHESPGYIADDVGYVEEGPGTPPDRPVTRRRRYRRKDLEAED